MTKCLSKLIKYLVLTLTPEHDTEAETLGSMVAQDKATGLEKFVEVVVQFLIQQNKTYM